MGFQDDRSKRLLITIDGPAGAGKTSVSKRVARHLGYHYMDTGALYRAVGLAADAAGVAADDDAALAALCRRTRIDLQTTESGLRVLLNGKDVTGVIRTPHISMMASAVSARPVVRDFLLNTQRTLGERKGVVAEGRDMGTVVFPHADMKFFLDADPAVRARRRFDELNAGRQGGPSMASVEKEMALRDKNDSSRVLAPLKPAPDAVYIDATHHDLDQVVAEMLMHIRCAT
ncbi:MAG: (d)CMP kinase [Desulfatitalea sp.]|nr:(d)CMP kinase [Desulfatitalea sp.]NNJ99934.1 (d)CMP kinase [Desulfatitalea sp.]